MEYVEQRNGGYYVAGTRVSLDSVVYAYLRGESPEEIADAFEALNLEQIRGAISYYVANRQAIDAYLEEGRAEFERLRQESRRNHPELYEKLAAAKRESLSRRS
jgi:uncharacterized protein (DUF433 family)